MESREPQEDRDLRGPGEPREPHEPAEPRERTSHGSRTRTLILETALRLFQERGYDKTTMRAIAQEAGVSVGNAYYYFASKEHLIQGFYDRITQEHTAAVADVLARERDLAGRLRGVLLTWLDIAAPYHRFAAQFFKNAADPDSPLSPFSDASEGPREVAIALHRQVLAGADTKADPELAQLLPQLLWLQQMGLILYWVHDRSENCERSRRLAERTSPLVARAVAASRFRVLRPLVREVTDVIAEFVLPAAAGATARPASGKTSAPPPPEHG
ncbi:TetR family transcriptional regulator [Streptomyces sp. CB02923]|uniref:TetR/AcrR family transcriptional regulator n=1 Tax=Streptomyces sp. CB02923 TaxID=1718985 RepID=UPI00093B25E3|nr:TetR family transcriptional regulator [Streptomyces sp. CB02923]